MTQKKLRNLKLVVFDMDGVLVDSESSWQFIHDTFGVNNDENFERYEKGEIDYNEFMRSDIRLWGSVSKAKISNILNQIGLRKGVKETINQLKKVGYKTVIISSGISLLANRVRKQLGIDHSFSNELLFDERDRLTGEAIEVVTLYNKGDILRHIAKIEKISPLECAVIGDSKYDTHMFKESGLSIAFNPKDDVVKEEADVTVEGEDLREIIPLLLEN